MGCGDRRGRTLPGAALANKPRAPSTKSQRTFITYAQENPHFKDQVLKFADKLRISGVDSRIDQYESHPAEGWPRWMENQFVEADRIIVVPSKTYLERYEQSTGIGSGARFEAAILRSQLMKNGVSFEKLAIAMFAKDDSIYIPDLLHGCSRYLVSNDIGFENLYRWLTNQPEITAPKLGAVKKLSSKRTIASIPNFQFLCRELKPLLDDNYRVFRDFGPNSGAGSKGPVRYNLNAWYALRESQIVPNNQQIREMIVEHRNVIPGKYKAIFERLISHIDAFQAHVGDSSIDYREHQFPAEIVDIINSSSR
jgi:hypothetical protein